MRSAVVGFLIALFGVILAPLVDRFMSGASESVWRVVTAATILTGLAVCLLSSPIWEIVRHPVVNRGAAAVVFAIASGITVGSGWWAFAPTAGTTVITKTPVIDNRVIERRFHRTQVGDLLKRGRVLQANVISISRGEMPEVATRVGPLAVEIVKWHVEVTRFFGENFGQAEADRVGAPNPNIEYPPRIMEGVRYENGKSMGGYDLRSQWAQLVGDLAALEQFLKDYPELKE